MKIVPATLLLLMAITLAATAPLFGDTYGFVQMYPGGTEDTFADTAVSGSNVAGDYFSNGDGQNHAYVYNFDTHAYTPVEPPSSQSTLVTGISGNIVAGYYLTGSLYAGFIYNLGTGQYLDVVEPDSDPNSSTTISGISGNNVVGTYYSGGSLVGFVYDIGTDGYTSINPQGSSATNVIAVSGNNVAGYYFDGSNNVGFVYNQSTQGYTTFDLSPQNDTLVTAVSGSNVAGYVYTGGSTKGFIRNIATSTTTFYDPSGGLATHLFAISGNNVAGYYFNGSANVSFVYNFLTTDYSPISPGNGNSFLSPTGLDGTQVVGTSNNGSSAYLGYVANATVTLSGNFTVNYNGSAQGLTATTSPAGRAVSLTYQQFDSSDNPIGFPSTAAPTSVGTYLAVASANDGTYMAYTAVFMTINTTSVTVTVSNEVGNSAPVYDGSPQSLTLNTVPSGVPAHLSYSGNSNTHGQYPNPAFGETDGPPTDAGTYFGTVVLDDPNYVIANPGDATGELDISSAPQTIDLSYLGTVTVNQVITLPATTAAGDTITYSLASFDPFDSSSITTLTAYASLTTPAGGFTDNVLTILKQGPVVIYAYAGNDQDHNAADQSGMSDGTTLGVDLDTATMAFGTLSFPFDHQVHAATVTTDPTYLATDSDVTFTYIDSQNNSSTSPPSAQGSYAVTAVINDPDDMWQGMLGGTLVIGSGYGSWQSLNFTAAQIADPSSNGAGAAATPLHDATPNLLKYFCDIDPQVPMTDEERADLPQVGMTANRTMLVLTYRRNGSLAGVTPTVQTSSDLKSWATATNATMSQTTATDPIVTVEVPVTITSGHPSQFLRLNLTMP